MQPNPIATSNNANIPYRIIACRPFAAPDCRTAEIAQAQEQCNGLAPPRDPWQIISDTAARKGPH
jgi:hypothetical protein